MYIEKTERMFYNFCRTFSGNLLTGVSYIGEWDSMEDEIRMENLNREEKKEFLKAIIDGIGNDKLLDYFCVFIPEKIKRAHH